MGRANSFQPIRVPIIVQIAALGLLALAGSARATDQAFDVVVTVNSTRVMSGEKSIGDIQRGTRLTVSQTNGDWYLIDLPNANPPRQGWIRKSDVKTALGPNTAATTVAPSASVTKEQQAELDDAKHLTSKVTALSDIGNFADAFPLAEKAVEIRKRILGGQHPDYATSINKLANLYAAKGDLAKAESLYLESFAIRKQVLGEKHPDYAMSLNNLGMLYSRQGRYAKAEPLLNDALAIQKQVLGEQHPDCARTMRNLGACTNRKVNSRRRSRCLSRRLQSARKRSEKSIPIISAASTIWPEFITNKAATRRPSRFSSKPQRSASNCSGRRIRSTPPICTTLE